jgi:L-rhamnose mutarotase
MWEADDLQVSQAAMARTEVNAEMAAFFVGLEGWAPNEGIVLLEQIFNLEDQTAEPDDDGLTRTARRLPRGLNDRSG